MKRTLAVILLAAALPAAAQFRSTSVSLGESDRVQQMRGHVSLLSSEILQGRRAGSEGEAEAAQYLYEKLEEAGVDMLSPRKGELFGIRKDSGDTLTSRNVYGFIQGYDPALRDRYIVIGARLDNLGTDTLMVDGLLKERVYRGANGNASGLAMLTELARMVSQNSILFRRSVIFIAFGASRQGYAGAWYFLNRSFGDAGAIDAMINLDMLGAGEEFYAYTSSNADMNSLLGKIELPPLRPVITAQEPYPSDHRAFYSAGIPSVMFTRGQYPQHDTARDTEGILDYDLMDRELETIYGFSLLLANAEQVPSFRPRQASDRPAERVYSYDEVDFHPSYMGSTSLVSFMEKWVYQYLKYPEEAVREGLQGTVNVRFIIDEKGNVRDAQVTKSAGELLDAQAIRVISASPKWKPARKDGKPVACKVTVPIEFKLTKKNKTGIKK